MPEQTPPSEKPSLEPLLFVLRGHRVILDADLAALYGVTTKALNQALKRNIDRFPSDFVFQMTPEEFDRVMRSQTVTASGNEENPSNSGDSGNRSQFVTGSENEAKALKSPDPERWSQIVTTFSSPTQKHRDPHYLPWVFTEHGALMAANILRSDRAAAMSIYVVRAFVRLRQVAMEHGDLVRRVAHLDRLGDRRIVAAYTWRGVGGYLRQARAVTRSASGGRREKGDGVSAG